MSFRLSKRLEAIARMVDQGAYCADVGADHGYLPIFLLQSGRISWAMAIENKMGPYLNLKANVDNAGLSGHISISLSDGISALHEGVDTLILAGMGGHLSIDILNAHPENLAHIDTIILDPHKDLMKIREYIQSIFFHIEDEEMIKEDGIYYSIIKAKRGEPDHLYTEDELRYGPIIMEKQGEAFLSYLKVQKKRVSDLLNTNLSKASREKYLALYRSISNQIKRYPSEER